MRTVIIILCSSTFTLCTDRDHSFPLLRLLLLFYNCSLNVLPLLHIYYATGEFGPSCAKFIISSPALRCDLQQTDGGTDGRVVDQGVVGTFRSFTGQDLPPVVPKSSHETARNMHLQKLLQIFALHWYLTAIFPRVIIPFAVVGRVVAPPLLQLLCCCCFCNPTSLQTFPFICMNTFRLA